MQSMRYNQNGVVCLPKLDGNVFSADMVDNVDHNTISRTANYSYNGTSISLVQHTTIAKPGDKREACTIVTNRRHQQQFTS